MAKKIKIGDKCPLCLSDDKNVKLVEPRNGIIIQKGPPLRLCYVFCSNCGASWDRVKEDPIRIYIVRQSGRGEHGGREDGRVRGVFWSWKEADDFIGPKSVKVKCSECGSEHIKQPPDPWRRKLLRLEERIVGEGN